MGSITVLVQGEESKEGWQVSVACDGVLQAFTVFLPKKVRERQRSWRQRFLVHHDATKDWADGGRYVQESSSKLRKEFQQWLNDGEWLTLQRYLEKDPKADIVLQLEGLSADEEQLPWEMGWAGHRCWRQINAQERSPKTGITKERCPRVLAVVGREEGVDLSTDIESLETQSKLGRIKLSVLRGRSCSANKLKEKLGDKAGWDAVVYLGHSSGGGDGGVLTLGNETLISGHALEASLGRAAQNGLRLLLLNSCSGLELAKTGVRAGIDWVLCSLEPLPDVAASELFSQLLGKLGQGSEFNEAISELRNKLVEKEGLEGCTQLLAVLSRGRNHELKLPLSKRRRFFQRLRSSSLAQLVATGGLIGLGMALELAAGNPVSSQLLDRRLEIQRQWREATGQEFKQAASKGQEPIAVLVLDDRNQSLGIPKNQTPGRVNRLALAEILKRTNPDVKRIGLDVVLDEDIPGTKELAEQISLRTVQVIAGHYGASRNLDPRVRGGEFSKPTQSLQRAGLISRDLAVGLPTRSDERTKQVPLRLIKPLGPEQFAVALSNAGSPGLPNGAIIDWSINWAEWIQWVQVEDLPQLRTPVLLVGSSGHNETDSQEPGDRFQTPLARRRTLSSDAKTSGNNDPDIPGVHVQAVLLQSINLKHWLQQADLTAVTALMAGLGVGLAAGVERRSTRAGVVVAVAGLSIPVTLQIAVSTSFLVPWLLPIAALSAGALTRND